MGTDLYHIVGADFDGLVKGIARDLKITVRPHYRDMDMSTVHERCKRLVDEFAESVMGHP